MTTFTNENIFVVTGASSGIGEGIALLLNKMGATVIGIGRNQDQLISLKEKSENPQYLHTESIDLSEKVDELPIYLRELSYKYGKLCGLVCSAGIDLPQALQGLNLNSGKHVFDINYFSPVFMAKGFADRRVNAGAGSSIVFIASTAGVSPDRGQTLYAASKAALIASSRSISKELSPRGIRCNCISPAYVETPMYYKNLKNIGTNIESYPLGIGKPQDIANITAFLLSKKARWITGQNYILDGGYL